MKKAGCILLIAGIFSLILAGCQAVFTFSPLSFLQRDPANLPLDQKIAWAEQALASGDRDAMETAYDAIKDDALSSSDAELTLLAANLAMELSGTPGLLFEVMEGNIQIDSSSDLDEFLQSVQGEYVIEAGTHFDNTLTNDPDTLTSTDYILGAMCLLFQAAENSAGGTVTGLKGAEVQTAKGFADAGLTNLPSDDPARDYLEDIYSFIADIE